MFHRWELGSACGSKYTSRGLPWGSGQPNLWQIFFSPPNCPPCLSGLLPISSQLRWTINPSAWRRWETLNTKGRREGRVKEMKQGRVTSKAFSLIKMSALHLFLFYPTELNWNDFFLMWVSHQRSLVRSTKHPAGSLHPSLLSSVPASYLYSLKSTPLRPR